MPKVKTSAVVTGEGFYYAETHEWDHLSPEQVQAIAEGLGEMTALAQNLSERGEPGNLTAVLSQEGIPGAEESLTVEGFSKEDMHRFQRKFTNMFDRLLMKFEDRRTKKRK